MAKIELLVPAGNREKLEVAVAYGADAVYFGSPFFSLRRRAGGFSLAETADAIGFCHVRGVKAYLTVNFLPSNSDFKNLAVYLDGLRSCPPDALIVGDPGVLFLCREKLPGVPLHLSTQANTVNYLSAAFWRKNGVSRVNLARELSLDEIAAVVAEVHGLECEVFVHGAMCMAYSGRCLLSSVLTGRHANRGDCAQPCRWKYFIQEEKRPGELMPLEEDQRGTYLFNARDLCLIARLPELQAAGVHSLKIEGRMKSAYYVAAVTRVYRQALDYLKAFPGRSFPADQLEVWKNELTRVSHRRYSEGFIDADRNRLLTLQYLSDSAYLRSYRFCALVIELIDYDAAADSSWVRLSIKDRLRCGESFEVLAPKMDIFSVMVLELRNECGEVLAEVHSGTTASARCRGRLAPLQILRQTTTPEPLVRA